MEQESPREGSGIVIREYLSPRLLQILPAETEQHLPVAPPGESDEVTVSCPPVTAEQCLPRIERRRRRMLPKRSGRIPCDESNTILPEEGKTHKDLIKKDNITDSTRRRSTIADRSSRRSSLFKKRSSGGSSSSSAGQTAKRVVHFLDTFSSLPDISESPSPIPWSAASALVSDHPAYEYVEIVVPAVKPSLASDKTGRSSLSKKRSSGVSGITAKHVTFSLDALSSLAHISNSSLSAVSSALESDHVTYQHQEKIVPNVKPSANSEVIINSTDDVTSTHKQAERKYSDWVVRRDSDGTRYITKRSTVSSSLSKSADNVHTVTSQDLDDTRQPCDDIDVLERDVIAKIREIQKVKKEKKREMRRMQKRENNGDDTPTATGCEATPAEGAAAEQKDESHDVIPPTNTAGQKRHRLLFNREFDWKSCETLAVF